MTFQVEVPPPELRKLLRYEPETGKLFWLPRPTDMFKTRRDCLAWNTKNALKEAFTSIDSCGYRQGRILGLHYLAHRVIWAIQTGAWPVAYIDHINRNRSDNRFENLREATRAENNRNTSKRSDNTSGYTGVCWEKRRKKWIAQIVHSGKFNYIGQFSTVEDAAAAYAKVAQRLHGEFAKTNTRTIGEA